MPERGPLDGIMEERIFEGLEARAMIEFASILPRMPEVGFTAEERLMFTLGFAACFAAVSREAGDR